MNEVVSLPSPPRTTEYIFRLYDELSRNARPQSMAGVAMIPPSEIGWWQINRRIRLNRFEREALIVIDAAFASVMTKQIAKNTKRS